MTEIFSFKAIIAAFLSVWARSAILFWSLAVCCLVVFIALVAGAHWQLGDAPVLLAAYGTILVLTFLVLFVLAAFTTYSERPPPTLSPKRVRVFVVSRDNRTAGLPRNWSFDFRRQT